MFAANIDKESDKEAEPYILGSSRRYGKETGVARVHNGLMIPVAPLEENSTG